MAAVIQSDAEHDRGIERREQRAGRAAACVGELSEKRTFEFGECSVGMFGGEHGISRGEESDDTHKFLQTKMSKRTLASQSTINASERFPLDRAL